jgi:anti-sigma regulatory factor (Ser/Thr protein kinase)
VFLRALVAGDLPSPVLSRHGGADPRTIGWNVETDGSTYFELKFAPTPRVINTVRRFVVEFFEEVLGKGDECSRVALATHELLENAIRHAPRGDTGLRVTVSELRDGCLVTICTRNVAEPDQVRRVRQILSDLGGTRAISAYNRMMNETAERPQGSGLGLARTRVEAEMELVCDEEEGALQVRAQSFVALRPGQ